MNEIDAFGTPTILHFAASLLISSILSAPWPSLSGAAIALDICGFLGVGYTLIVLRRARSQTGYQPVLEDWVWHVILPLAAYTALSIAAMTLVRHAVVSLFIVGGTALLLLFIGIHNAWDTVTFLALGHTESEIATRPTDDQPASE
jgi:hypothetical protein